MLNRDQVICDLCFAPMGQLHGPATRDNEWNADFGLAPQYAVCPDCQAAEHEPSPEAVSDQQ